MIWPSLEANLTNFLVIRTHLSRRFHLVVDFLGLRRNDYDDKHFTTYIFLLNADAENAFKEVKARTVLGLDPAREPDRGTPAR